MKDIKGAGTRGKPSEPEKRIPEPRPKVSRPRQEKHVAFALLLPLPREKKATETNPCKGIKKARENEFPALEFHFIKPAFL